MKYFQLILGMLVTLHGVASAQERIYRCGNEYTNTVTEERSKNCKLISGGNVTVVQAVKPAAKQGGSSTITPNPQRSSDTADQRSKDSDARLILEAELKKAEARKLELQKEYNNGEPEKLGPETRNHQKYLDRIAELKAAISRNEDDIAGIRRELARVPGSSLSNSSSGVTSGTSGH